jgi:hypothetical protein
LDNESRGINSGMAAFNQDYRMRFYAPEPGSPNLTWGVTVPGQGSMTIGTSADQMERWIPPHYRAQIADWMHQALAELPPGVDRPNTIPNRLQVTPTP